ncbi:Malonyl-coenzyme:anthocyanin 5-O-glucoside-6'''-O-malonyltransferase [Quillaja saponaria]|uniref:Malonyl-coenzyme:anthocyanin 5-O-glucoside-6'''-O-malonyltransferase n=1 Tax=Quillaja saponaria TaxID=32244 RepID=A0AAD7PGC3_QUISA|nr:Malonyl-coenzyme:anthocyanin 5-O-glucoside-6'''-O-malonyltransferase [Quillaja saponaria]
MADNTSNSVKILDHCQVAPPPASAPSSTSLPLTFFDITWLLCRPMERIFFYESSYPTHQFIETILPTLKLSLSHTLQHFFPLASNLICPPPPNKPHLLYVDGSSVSFTLAESTADFNHLVSNYPSDVTTLHHFVPRLPLARVLNGGTRVVPPSAIQVTLVSSSGIAICVKFHHVAADGRAVIEDLNGLESIFLKQWWIFGGSEWKEDSSPIHDVCRHKVRATFLLGRPQIEKLKLSTQTSTFVVTCALIWVCLIKSEQSTSSEQVCYFVFVADCRDRFGISLPTTYFGNCLALCFVPLKRRVLAGENGIVEAMKAIGNRVRELEREGAERWMLEWKEVIEKGHHLVSVAGSPKLGAYETDFGWGRPKKNEMVQIDTALVMYINETRDEKGGIEIGLALERAQMNNFTAIFEACLKEL